MLAVFGWRERLPRIRMQGQIMRTVIGIGFAVLTAGSLAYGQDQELWNKQQVLTALVGLSVASEEDCSDSDVASSA